VIGASIQGQNQHHKIIAKPYFQALKKNPIPDSTLKEQVSQHPFLTHNREKNWLTVERGVWHVGGSLVVPAGITLKIPAGTTLRFMTNEGLFSHGPLDFQGTKEYPIILEGVPSEEDKNSWQGVALLNADSPSVWTHVIVRNTNGISQAGWQLTGGVTVYKSDIRMNDCCLQGNRSEDALNIVHSKFELDGIEIFQTASDGFDAIDISGSKVFVREGRFFNISDKALSVGEQSEMTTNKVLIEYVGTGAACKDGSYLKITDSSIKDANNAGLMAYIKKAEYGPARIDANNLVFVGAASEARVQQGSHITLNGIQIESEDVDVETLYKTIMKPGLKR